LKKSFFCISTFAILIEIAAYKNVFYSNQGHHMCKTQCKNSIKTFEMFITWKEETVRIQLVITCLFHSGP